jgi:hypothetical protein
MYILILNHLKINKYFSKETKSNIIQRLVILQFDKINRQSFITGSMSKTETFLAHIVNKLEIQLNHKSFKEIAYSFVKYTIW